jgi:4-amino-4-deoxy-L-arabinose transferase-like glycosyltransferase
MSQEPESRRDTSILARAVVLAAVAISAWITASTMGTVPYRPGSDDGYYLRYMQRVANQGPEALPRLHRWWLEEDEGRHHIYPPPTRVGFIALTALWAKPFGVSFESLAWFSWASFLALIALHFAFARRHLGDLPAALATALLAFSPVHMSASQRAMTDSTISLFQVLAMWLFYELTLAPRSRGRWLAFVAAFAFAILVKEISVLLALPFAAFAVLQRFGRRRELPAAPITLALVAPVLVALAAWTAAAGGVRTLVEVFEIVLVSPGSNPSAIRYGSGPWSRYVIDAILVSPWPTVLGIAGMALAAWRWRHGEFDSLAVYCALVCVLQVAALGPFTKNLRYAAALEAPLRVLAVSAVCALFAGARARLAVAAVALVCALEAASFDALHLEARIYDPVTQALATARHVVPGAPEQ